MASTNAGLHLVMPDGGCWGNNLTRSVDNSSVLETRLNVMITRILAAYYYLNQDQGHPGVCVYPLDHEHRETIDVRADHASLIRETGSAGHVLVRNVNNKLPLSRPRLLNIYGYNARLLDSPWTNPSQYQGGYEINFGWKTLNDTLITGGGSGWNTPPYVISPSQALLDRLLQDRGTLG